MRAEIGNNYVLNSSVYRKSVKANNALLDFCAALDNCVCGEYLEKPDEDVVVVYFFKLVCEQLKEEK